MYGDAIQNDVDDDVKKCMELCLGLDLDVWTMQRDIWYKNWFSGSVYKIFLLYVFYFVCIYTKKIVFFNVFFWRCACSYIYFVCVYIWIEMLEINFMRIFLLSQKENYIRVLYLHYIYATLEYTKLIKFCDCNRETEHTQEFEWMFVKEKLFYKWFYFTKTNFLIINFREFILCI